MNPITYLIEVSSGLAIFYIFFEIFLQKETFFSINRYYLLASILTALLIPFLNFSVTPDYFSDPDDFVYFENTFSEFSTNVEQVKQNLQKNISVSSIIYLIYFLGVSICIILFLIQIIRLAVIIKKNKIIKKFGLNIVLIDNNKLPFSFFKYVFINNNKFNTSDFQKILTHEQVHANQMHTLDLIIIELLTIFLWFNPFIFWYKKSLKETHEFLADQGVLKSGVNKSRYFTLLSQELEKNILNGLTSNFYSLTKKRIKMMTKNTSKTIAKYKVLLSIPLLTILMLLFAFSFKNTEFNIENKINLLPGLNDPENKNITLICPIKKGEYRFASGWGMRIHPIYKIEKMHYGIDLAAKKGTNVLASADGEVIKIRFSKERKGHGHYIIIKHNDVYSTWYTQLSEFEVEEGQKIKQGDIVGLVGSSGVSTAPHLHYEVHKNSERVNPIDYFEIDKE